MSTSDTLSKSSPILEVRLPAALEAWQLVEATVEIRNTLTQSILPIELKLSTTAGVIAHWGIEGRVQRWGVMTTGRITADKTEVLTAGDFPQQQPAGPSVQQEQAAVQFVRFEPLMPSESVVLKTSFAAAYGHRERMDVVFAYITLDVAQRRICVAKDSPTARAFVECLPVANLARRAGVHFYLPAAELARDRESLSQSVPLAIRHPAFDIDQARARAGIAAGPYGYDTNTHRWILVDEQAKRTHRIGERNEEETMPGQWLDLLMALNSAPAATVSWNTGAVPLTDAVRARLSAAGMAPQAFAHKDYRSPTNVLLTIDHAQVAELARLLDEISARLEGLRIVK